MNEEELSNQVAVLIAYNTLKGFEELKDVNVYLNFSPYDTTLRMHDVKNLVQAKKLLDLAGIKCSKLEKQRLSNNSQYATGDSTNLNLHINIYASGLFENCYLVEVEETVDVPERLILAQPAIEEHVEPAHTATIKKKVIKCGQ